MERLDFGELKELRKSLSFSVSVYTISYRVYTCMEDKWVDRQTDKEADIPGNGIGWMYLYRIELGVCKSI